MKIYNLILLVLGTMLLFACNNQEQKSSSTDPHQEVERTWEQYVNAMKTVNVDSVIAFWADDLKLITYSAESGHPFRKLTDTFLEKYFHVNLKKLLFVFQNFSHRFSIQIDTV